MPSNSYKVRYELFEDKRAIKFMDKNADDETLINRIHGKYYQLDLTFLDSLLNDKKIDPNDYNFEFNSAYYLVPVGDEEAEKSNSEPYEAKE